MIRSSLELVFMENWLIDGWVYSFGRSMAWLDGGWRILECFYVYSCLCDVWRRFGKIGMRIGLNWGNPRNLEMQLSACTRSTGHIETGEKPSPNYFS